MAFKLSKAQQNQLENLLGELLDAYKSGQFSKGEVVGALAHIVTASVIDNEKEVEDWLEKPEVLERWRTDTSKFRTKKV